MIFFIVPAFRNTLKPSQKNFNFFMSLKGKIFRQVKDRTTLSFNHHDNTYFIKQHHGVGLAEIVKNLIRGRLPIISAKNEWRALQYLEKNGLGAPKVVAYGEKGFNPATRQSFLVMPEFKNKISLYDFLENPRCDQQFRQRLIVALAKFTKKLHDLGVHHRDYYLVHLCLDQTALKNDEIKLFVFDLHRAGINKKIPRKWLIKDLASLYFSSYERLKDINTNDVRLFLETYFEMNFEKLKQQNASLLKKIERKAEKIYTRDHRNKPFKRLI